MNFLRKIIAGIAGLFTSGKAEAALTLAASLVPKAVTIVETIAATTPNRTDDEIATAFRKYGVPMSVEWLNAPPGGQRGYLLLHLATEVLAGIAPGVTTAVLNTAVQMAVAGVKAK